MPGEPRPFSDFRDSGLLWLMNRVVFHPRGYALALHFEEDGTEPTKAGDRGGTVIGWSLIGDGTEPWSMGPEIAAEEDRLFLLTKELLA